MTIAASPCRRKAAQAAMRPPTSVPPTRWIALCQAADGYACRMITAVVVAELVQPVVRLNRVRIPSWDSPLRRSGEMDLS